MSSPAPDLPPLAPLPFATLAYATPLANRRPGILTAVGIISIVIGCLSGLSSCGGVASGFMFMKMSGMTITPPAPAPIVVGGGSVKIGGVPWDAQDTEDGLAPPQINSVTAALSRVRSLSDQRRAHLALLLAAHGKAMFPAITVDSTEAEIHSAINGAAMTNDGANWYTIGTGRIEIDDQRAIYRPSDGGNVAEASAPMTANASPTAPATGPTLAYSTVTYKVSGVPGVTRTPATTAAPAPMPITMFKISPLASWLSISENLLSFGVAVLLGIAGIMVLRDSLRAYRLHRIYVVAKIPLVFVAAVATWLTTSGMMSGMFTTPAGPPPPGFTNWMITMQVAMGTAMAIAYPIALIFILMTRRVKHYYAEPQTP